MFGEAESTDKWQRREISAVSSVFTGKTPPTSDIENYADEVPFVTPSDLRGLITSTQRSVSEKGARLIRTVRKGSCLVGCIGDIGKVGYVDMQVTFNQQINAIEWNNTLVDDIYGYFVIKYMEKVFKSKAVSAVVPILNKKNFSCIQIPIPPLNDQHRFSSVVRQIWKIRTDMQNHLPNRLFASLQSQSFAVN